MSFRDSRGNSGCSGGLCPGCKGLEMGPSFICEGFKDFCFGLECLKRFQGIHEVIKEGKKVPGIVEV